MRTLSWGRVLLTLLCLSAVAFAKQPPSHSRLRVDTRFVNAPGAKQYPHARAIFLQDNMGFEVRPDGSTAYTEHDAIKLLDARGVREYQDMTRVYRRGAQSITVLAARTIEPDGRVVEVPARDITDTRLLAKSKLYAAYRRLHIHFPDAKPGAVVEFRLVTTHTPRRDKQWWATTYVQNPDPVLISTFAVTVPAGEKFRYATPGLGHLVPRKTQEGGVDRYYWAVKDQPQIASEPAMPAAVQVLRRIEVTSFDSWQALGNWFDQGWPGAVQPFSSVGLRTAGLLPTVGTSSQRLESILTWLDKSKESAAFGDSQFTPSPVNRLIDEPLVSNLDMAALTASMVRFAGYHVQPVLAFAEPLEEQSRELPLPSKIQRVILRVKTDSHTYWIDPLHVGELQSAPPSGFQSSAGLVAGSSEGLVELPAGRADNNRQELRVEARITRSGLGELGLQLANYGESGLLWREAARALSASRRSIRERTLDGLFARLALAFSPRARVHQRYFDLKPSPDQPFDLAATLIIPGFATRNDSIYEVPLPVQVNNRLRSLLDQVGQRRYPIHFDHPFRDETRIHLVFPKGAEVVKPPPTAQVDNQYGAFLSSSRVDGNQLWYYSQLVVKKAWIPSQDFAQLLEVARLANESQQAAVGFRPGASRAQEKSGHQ